MVHSEQDRRNYLEWYDKLKWPIPILDQDEETKEKATRLGLFATGKAIAVKDLTMSEANQSTAVISVLHAEAEREAEATRVAAEVANEEARKAALKKSTPPRPKTAQELINQHPYGQPRKLRSVTPKEPAPSIRLSDRQLPTADELKHPPRTLRRNDLAAIGKWAETIRDGRTRLVD